MMTVSDRYSRTALVLLAATLLVVSLHTGNRRQREDCADSATLNKSAAFPFLSEAQPVPFKAPPQPELERQRWVVSNAKAGTPALYFTLLRSQRPFDFYLRPAAYAIPGIEPSHTTLKLVQSGDTTLPVHWISDDTSRTGKFAAYFFTYRGKPVRQPFFAHVAALPSALAHGTTPMTLFMLSGETHPLMKGKEMQQAERWLSEAWQSYRAVCEDPRN